MPYAGERKRTREQPVVAGRWPSPRSTMLAIERWLEARDWDEGAVLLVIGAALGIAGGLAVVLFYRLIDVSHLVFIEWPGARVPAWLRVLYWPVLTAGGLWAAWFVVRRGRLPDGQNVPDVQLAVAKRDAAIPGRPVALRTVASAITLGAGGSAGSEGPVAVLGSALGSKLAGWLPIRPRHRRVLVGCGAAAGIAAAFNAPFAGAFFALEEVLGTFSVGAFSPVVIASVVGSVTARLFLGSTPIFALPPAPDSHPIASLMLYPVLGVVCGAVAALHARAYLAAPALARRIPGPDWVRPLVGGAVVGAIVAGSGGLLVGDGHLAIPTPVFGGLAWWMLILLALAKIAATAVTLSTGGSGGVFTPTLFVGAAAGGGLGALLAGALPELVHPYAWAFVGMGGLVAGATRAPLTAIFIVYEMTDDPTYIGPLIIVAIVSLITSRRLAPHGLYDGWLAQRGVRLAHGVDRALMDHVEVASAMERDTAIVPQFASLDDLVIAAADARHTTLPVVDQEHRVVGMVSHHGIRDALNARSAVEALLVAEDLAEPVEPLGPEQSLREALAAMNARGLDALPVCDDDGVLLGLLSREGLLKRYEAALAHTP